MSIDPKSIRLEAISLGLEVWGRENLQDAFEHRVRLSWNRSLALGRLRFQTLSLQVGTRLHSIKIKSICKQSGFKDEPRSSSIISRTFQNDVDLSRQSHRNIVNLKKNKRVLALSCSVHLQARPVHL